jgi:hypothetical protein
MTCEVQGNTNNHSTYKVQPHCISHSKKKIKIKKNNNNNKLKPHNRNSAHMECESVIDTGNKGGDWNHFSIIQTIPEQHIRIERN